LTSADYQSHEPQRAIDYLIPADVAAPARCADQAGLYTVSCRIEQRAAEDAGDVVRLAAEFDAVGHLGSHIGIVHADNERRTLVPTSSSGAAARRQMRTSGRSVSASSLAGEQGAAVMVAVS
jgi:hypothetical protein